MFAEIAGARIAATVENIAVAHRDIVRASSVRLLSAGSRCLLAVVVLGIFHVHDLTLWIWCTTAQSIITACAFLYICTRSYGKPKNAIVIEEIGTGLLFAINQTSRAGQGNFDRAFMASVANGNVIGAYAAGSRLVQLGLFPVQILNRLLYPRFFAHGAAGGLVATRALAKRCAPIAFAVGVFGALTVGTAALAAPYLLGPSFAKTTNITLALSCALPLMALQYPAADALTGAGKQATRTILFAITALLFSIGLAVGATFYGLWGVVYAFVAGHAALAAILWIFVFRSDAGNAVNHDGSEGSLR
jgi:O-antigen/teichoic acid export membrane protein